MYESGKPKRKRKPEIVRPQSYRIYIFVGLLMVLILGGALAALVLIQRNPTGNAFQMTATAILATNQKVETWIAETAAIQPTLPPVSAASSTPLPIPTYTPVLPTSPPGQPGDKICTWHVTTRADPNGLTLKVQQKLDQALLPVEVRAMVYLTGDECLETDVMEGPDFYPRHTDFYLLVKADDRFLNANIDTDYDTQAQLGFLVRQILNVIDADFTPDKTEGSETDIITMTFVNGDVIRSASFTQNELAISRYNEYEVGTAIIAAIGGLQ